jgi:transcriptional regulator with XRE-family HTH domain
MQLEEILGSNVRGFRKNLGLTLEQLSEAADLHSTWVGDIERSHANITIETLKKLANALKVDADILLRKGAFLDAEKYQRVDHRHTSSGKRKRS